jgi:hypothetical protein
VKNQKWKSQSLAFRQAMQAARASGTDQPATKMNDTMNNISTAIQATDSDLIPCPYCQRTFNERAAERHIPICQNIKAKPSTLKRGQSNQQLNASMKSTTNLNQMAKNVPVSSSMKGFSLQKRNDHDRNDMHTISNEMTRNIITSNRHPINRNGNYSIY